MRQRLYGLPKLHKPDIPLRPILSMVNSPQHGLAKFLNAMLEPVIAYFARFIVKDSFEVVRRIRSVGAESTFVSSFDVKKLFSNVPLDEVISTSTDMLYSLQKPSIKSTSQMCFQHPHFLFCAQLYNESFTINLAKYAMTGSSIAFRNFANVYLNIS